jgi:two-component system, cell cycle response regulator
MATSLTAGVQSPLTQAPPRVLLGVSDARQRSQLQALLERWSYPAETAIDGGGLLAALEGAEAAPIIILDSALPGLKGTVLLHRLQLQSTRRRSWIILLANDAASETCNLAGIDDVLATPIDEFQLRVSLHAATRVQARAAIAADAIDAARFHASHDSLTGLWNREALLNLLFQEADRSRRLGSPLAFVLLDLDRFAEVNRQHGHDAGDRVLRQLAGRFRRFLRSYDLAGRSGEDEFLIALPGCNIEDARTLATRLRDCVADRPFDILQSQLRLTASLGVALSRGRSPLAVLRDAESALAAAKNAGGGCLRCFSPPSPESETTARPVSAGAAL